MRRRAKPGRIPMPRLPGAAGRSLLGWVLAIAIAGPPATRAATVTATVTDEVGKPLPGAVVAIMPEPGHAPVIPALVAARIASASIDQKDETFVPQVVVVRVGGTVTFRNSDNIRHHVYSFSPPRRFEMVQLPGEASQPLIFDKPGAVAIGCNIHDHMTAYVFVTEAPWAMVTNDTGQAILSDIPAGGFIATVWHPRLRPKAPPSPLGFTIANQDSRLAITLSVLPPRRPRERDY